MLGKTIIKLIVIKLAFDINLKKLIMLLLDYVFFFYNDEIKGSAKSMIM